MKQLSLCCGLLNAKGTHQVSRSVTSGRSEGRQYLGDRLHQISGNSMDYFEFAVHS